VLLSSADGISWANRTAGLTDYPWLYGVAFGKGTFVVVGWSQFGFLYGSGPGGLIYSSPDGVAWTSRPNDFALCGPNYFWDLTMVAFGNGTFVACGQKGLLTSP